MPKQVLAAMHHRGPDASGAFSASLGSQSVALFHTRLSIIDLNTRADQPFVRDGLTLVYNGEIYNFSELRQELKQRGHVFATQSDTEVVLEAYREWGADCVNRFDGMWALALLDENAGTLWLSRDRFGEKPLFWARMGDSLFFASEVKALEVLAGRRFPPNIRQLRRYLVNGYKSLFKQQDTWHVDVQSLTPGHSVLIDGDKKFEPTCYWSLTYKPCEMNAGDMVEGVRERFFNGLERRLRSDVPLAFCLSGGIDSGALACIAAKEFGARVHGFSIVDSDSRYDERDTLMETVSAIECQHTIVQPGKTGFLSRMARLVADHDAPVSTISYYVHAQLAEAIHDTGYKVAISGTGADEIFTGYYDHYNFWLAEFSNDERFGRFLSDWKEGYGSHVRNRFLKDPADIIANPGRRDHIYLDRGMFNSIMLEPVEEEFFESAYSQNNLRNRMLNELNNEVVPMILQEDDLNSMRVSVENRSPYLDHELVEFAFTIPNEHLVSAGRSKWPLRAAAKGYLPDPVRLERRKRGFNASIDTMLDRNDPDVRDWCLSDSPIFDHVNRDAFARFFDGDMTSNSFSKFLFSFVSAKTFLEQRCGSIQVVA